MADFEERIYTLGVEALAEQERQVSEVRGRASAILAAGAVVPSLLAHAVFRHNYPHGPPQIVAAYLGVAGAVGVLVCTVNLLRPRELGFSIKASQAYQELFKNEVLEQPGIDLALADAFDERRVENTAVVDKLTQWFAGSLVALVIETLGLALAAALAS
ncbi:MAG: hypothetical protein ACRDNK_23520 [Solirubrobacteraceae bacterium]